MASVILSHEHVREKKVMFGLITRYEYSPTGSVLRLDYKACGASTGETLRNALEKGVDELKSALKSKKLDFVDIGSMQLAVCQSADHNFVALQLESYYGFMYHPVSEVIIFENDDAREVLSLLS